MPKEDILEIFCWTWQSWFGHQHVSWAVARWSLWPREKPSQTPRSQSRTWPWARIHFGDQFIITELKDLKVLASYIETLLSVLCWSSSSSRKGELPDQFKVIQILLLGKTHADTKDWWFWGTKVQDFILPESRIKQRTPKDHWSVSVVIAS